MTHSGNVIDVFTGLTDRSRSSASGAAAGMGYENNTRAGLITRSLAEMTRIGVAYGGNPLTFLSLAGKHYGSLPVALHPSHRFRGRCESRRLKCPFTGVGDLFLTCNSPTSRVSHSYRIENVHCALCIVHVVWSSHALMGIFFVSFFVVDLFFFWEHTELHRRVSTRQRREAG